MAPRTHTGASDFFHRSQGRGLQWKERQANRRCSSPPADSPPICGASSSTLGVVTNISEWAEWPLLRKRGAAAGGGAWAGARGVGRSVGAGAPRRG
jgi:hypothetical protein